jgi:hypothetical protein
MACMSIMYVQLLLILFSIAYVSIQIIVSKSLESLLVNAQAFSCLQDSFSDRIIQLQKLYNGCFSYAAINDEDNTNNYNLFVKSASSLLGLDTSMSSERNINIRYLKIEDLYLKPLQLSMEQFLSLTNIAIDEAQNSVSSHENQVSLLCSWICLVASKVLMICWMKHKLAIAWAKKALSYLAEEKNIKKPTLSICTPGSLLVRFESMLLISELYEQMGQFDRCVPYLSEARSIATATKSLEGINYLEVIYSLHAVRIWERTDSNRFSHCIELLQTFSRCKDYTRPFLIRSCLDFITYALEGNSEDAFDRSTPFFRYICFQYDTFRIEGCTSRTIQLEKFHTSLHPSARYRLMMYLLSSEALIHLTLPLLSNSYGGALTKPQDETMFHIVNDFLDVFDVVRYLSRKMSLEVMRNARDERGIMSILLQANSCSTSIVPWRDDLASLAGGLLPALQSHCKTLQRKRQIIHTLCYEKYHGYLLIGRNCDEDSYCVALPTSVSNLETVWGNLLKENSLQLTQTLDAADVNQWSESRKKEWWIQRQRLDEDMKSFTVELQEKIGIWRCLFTALPANKNETDNMEKLIINSINWSDIISDATSPQLKYQPTESLLRWIVLVIFSCDSTFLTQPISKNEAILLLENIFSSFSLKCKGSNFRWVETLIDTFLGRHEEKITPTSIRSENKETYENLNVNELKLKLKTIGLQTTGKKIDLISRLTEYDHQKQTLKAEIQATKIQPLHYLNHIIVLDEILQTFPWENIPVLTGRMCSRIPNLFVLENILHYSADSSTMTNALEQKTSELAIRSVKKQNKNKSTDTDDRLTEATKLSKKDVFSDISLAVPLSRCWYCIDPDNNLARTRDTMASFIEPVGRNLGWQGWIGSKPTESEVR